MTVAKGTKLGPYEFLGAIGAGGMGEVYRARDMRLGRDVALKVLPEGVARDTERMARFRREAQVLASLNHPNIAAIYGFEDSGSVHALAMELVEGQTLADLITRDPMPLDEALPIAKQICEAVEYAHERGIIHRDLKPANIKLASNDAVKILDFGLAKALEGNAASVDISSSPTISRMATQAGIILGTAAYMSPEQAKGKSVDRRTDIWAFGCVLYEMLTAKKPFDGETVTDTLAAVIKSEPDWSLLPANTSPAMRNLLQRCLKKDFRQRLQSIGDARIAIEELLSGAPQDSPQSTAIAAVIPAPLWRRALPWALATTLGIALIASGVALRPSAPSTPQPVARFAITMPVGQAPAIDRGWVDIALSNDGAELAFVGGGDNPRLYVRPMEELEATALPGTKGASSPFFSPDGKWIGFFADGKLKKVTVTGGEPITLCDAPTNRGGAWLPDGTIVFSPTLTSGLMKVSTDGGTPAAETTLNTSKGERTHRWPQALPGGKAVLFTVGGLNSPTNFDDAQIAVLSVKTGKYTVLLDHAAMARYVPVSSSSGYLLFARAGRLFAAPFDAKRLKVTGESFPALQGVTEAAGSGATLFAVSPDGSLAYIPGAESIFGGVGSSLDWMDSSGKAWPIPLPSQYYYQRPALSPNGRRIAVVAVGTGNPGISGIYIWDDARQVLSRLTFNGQADSPVWAPDGKRVAYRSAKPKLGIYWKAADGSGRKEPLVFGQIQYGSISFSPDGKFLAYTIYGAQTNNDVWILPLGGNRKPFPFLDTPANEANPQFSPDGHWLAYTSDESGQDKIYVRAFPGPGGKWQLSSGGKSGTPVWARDGRELYYLAGDKLMEVPIETKPAFAPGTPEQVFQNAGLLVGGSTDAASLGGVAENGQRYLMLIPSRPEAQSTSEQTPIDVVLNFASELKNLARGEK